MEDPNPVIRQARGLPGEAHFNNSRSNIYWVTQGGGLENPSLLGPATRTKAAAADAWNTLLDAMGIAE